MSVSPMLTPSAFSRLRALLFALCLVPLARLVWLGSVGGLGANPVEFVVRSLGTWTLVALLATLAVTPLRLATGWVWLARLRRMLGLFTFFYALLHFGAYLGLDQWFDLAAIARDVLKRPYITVGFASLLLLLPLAVTSTNGWVKRLGARRWQRLHRLVYLVAPLAVTHLWWQKAAKNDLDGPIAYAIVLAVLLGVRALRALRPAAGARQGSVFSSENRSAAVSRRRTS
jgi:sulfoxide reductase heme-binding subunit YedZ